MTNQVLEVIKTRRSCKKYTNEVVADDILDLILEAGTYAPTGKNMQSPIIVCVKNKELRDKLSRLNSKILGVDIDPFYNAPVVVCVLYDKNIPTGVYDASCVLENMMLASHSLGVDSCWIHRCKEMFETEEGKDILSSLGITGNYEGCGNLILGYRDYEITQNKPRKENYIYKVE